MKPDVLSSHSYRFVGPLFATFALSSCVTANTDTVKDMSDGLLCELIGPDWISTASERDAIYREIESRGVNCLDGKVAGYESKRGGTDESSQPGSTGGSVRYECYTYDYPPQHVLTLPVAPLNSPVGEVTITFHGDRVSTIYQRDGLTQLWILERSLYVQLDLDFVARYMDFRGADEGERRQAEAVFECEKRN